MYDLGNTRLTCTSDSCTRCLCSSTRDRKITKFERVDISRLRLDPTTGTSLRRTSTSKQGKDITRLVLSHHLDHMEQQGFLRRLPIYSIYDADCYDGAVTANVIP